MKLISNNGHCDLWQKHAKLLNKNDLGEGIFTKIRIHYFVLISLVLLLFLFSVDTSTLHLGRKTNNICLLYKWMSK